ncbi:Phosphoenolpyruvate-protein phosphotransferase [Tautonia plasticadhaerens]|uniref:Phosphoenolpyruvate-protein phosphotransferase n=2 Tax=Tautonia plasticadhaerens TaxID=2527974 RepID=A0A518H4S6_9BACT|nr:Phosphoenolpyruvate-protein phosphotransferase [Tautonia plasticadhaerens]
MRADARPAPADPASTTAPDATSTAPWPLRDPAVSSPAPAPRPMKILRGIAVSPGVAIGPVLVLAPRGPRLARRAVPASAVEQERRRLDRALESARLEAEAAERDARSRLGPQYADILAAHVRMIADPTLRREAVTRIDRDRIAAEHAIFDVLDGYARRLERLGTAHLAARAADVRDIQRRILDQLTGQPPSPSPADSLVEPLLLLAEDLSPSEAAALDPSRVLGFATESGGRTSHTAIIAAALEIPAVVGLGRVLDGARDCRSAIIDGDGGMVILDPDEPTLRRYRRHAVERATRFAELSRLSDLPAETADGSRIRLLGNIEFPAEVDACRERGADGIGLFRTEFFYLADDGPPGELEQAEAYAAVIRALPGKPVTIRTLDLGSDKSEPGRALHVEPNPALGLRSLRRSLRDPGPFRLQLRAILRAAAITGGDVRVMFPLVTTLDEFRQARATLRDVAAELLAEGTPARADLPVGAMIEVPAAAIMSDLLAKEVDFFSIGTNDLTQYILAADRTNETVADLYTSADPAVLRLIDTVARAAEAAGIEVTVCGSIAGEPLYTMLLLGMGIQHLSTPPHQLPEVKRVIRAVQMDEARALAREALRRGSAAEVLDLLRQAFRRVLPDDPAEAGAVGP